MSNLRISSFPWKQGMLIMLLSGCMMYSAFSQERTVRGTVSSQDEGPLPGVNVVLQGTTQGTMTDPNGTYTINVPGPDAVLVFSFISYTTQNITVGERTVIDVVLESAVSALTEVVVVGYGTQQRRETTSSIASVKSDEFNQGSVNNPVQLIQGKVSGLAISRPGGDPNGSFDIRLRGLSTIGANLGPLVVIDGIIGGSLNNVDPNDIESINVLKDGSAAAIYGTRGSSGVILVTTKKGRSGVSSVDYNVYGTVEMVARNTDVMNASEWRALSDEVNLGTDFGASTDWFDEIENTSLSQVHNISMSGGTEKTNYRAAINYRDAKGIILNTGYNQLNGRINLTQRAINDKFTLDLNLGATERESELGFTEAFRYATIYNPTAPVRSDDPAYDVYDGYFQQVLFDYYNPVSILELNTNQSKERIFNVSLKGAYAITNTIGVDAFYAIQSSGILRGQYLDMNDYWGGMNRHGLATRQQDNASNKLFETTVRYLGDITPDINLNVMGGYSYQDFLFEGVYAQGGNFLVDNLSFNSLGSARDFDDGLGTVSSYKNSNKLIAFFGRINLNINSTWFLMASARYEGSSRFGAGNHWGLFPAVGLGADISQFLDIGILDNLKIRINYGLTGNQPSSSYLSLRRLGQQQGYFLYNDEYIPVYDNVSNENADLKWEKKGEFDAGFDFSILNSVISGSFDFYTRTTTDLLFQYEVPVPPNLFTQAWLNLGQIKSSGLELSLDYRVISNPDFTYTMSFTPSYILENTLVSLSGTYNGADLEYGTQDLSGMGSPGQNQVPLVRVQEGEPIGQLFMMKYQEIDENGNLILVDTNEDGTIDQADRQIVGNGLPKFLFGFGHNLTYKNLDASVFFRGVFGHDLINSFRGFYEVPNMIGSYNLPSTATDMRNPTTGTLLNNSSGILSDYHVEDAGFVALDNASIGYSFNLAPDAQFSKIRVYLAGNNLFFLTGYSGVDPNPRYVDNEDQGTLNSPLVPGVDRRNTWFRTRSFTLGANIVF